MLSSATKFLIISLYLTKLFGIYSFAILSSVTDSKIRQTLLTVPSVVTATNNSCKNVFYFTVLIADIRFPPSIRLAADMCWPLSLKCALTYVQWITILSTGSGYVGHQPGLERLPHHTARSWFFTGEQGLLWWPSAAEIPQCRHRNPVASEAGSLYTSDHPTVLASQ